MKSELELSKMLGKLCSFVGAWLFVFLGFTGQTEGQITGEVIATNIAGDSGGSAQQYLAYGFSLAKTLKMLDSEALTRVFGEPTTVELPDTLNEHLDLDDINFLSGSYELTPLAMMELDKVVDFLAENPDLQIIVEGHTQFDTTRSQELSENRAEAAVAYLVELGIDPSRLEAVGYGASQPLVESDDSEVTAANRRIEIRVKK